MKMSPRAELALSMIIFGTIGIFRRFIPLSSPVLACARGLIGAAFLLVFMRLKGEKPDAASIRRNAPLTLLSGVLIGVNWILLFEAFRFTSVAVATLCYYMQPVFVILASPLVMKEKLSAKKLLCTAAALLGMILVSDVIGGAGQVSSRGVILGLLAALIYASVIMLNKFIKGIEAIDRTFVQISSAGLVLIPYILLTEGIPSFDIGAFGIIMTLIAGVVHTGIAYVLYFESMESIPVQTIAIMSYLDPVVALLLSVFLLKEPFGISQLMGAALILGAGYLAEKN
ncbi:MAG: EamA family transporter [Firmicutes bacterium]|nr:EamA family transporter [Bacillota bacterium]